MTNPMRLGAPLTGDEKPPTDTQVRAEIYRAQIELLYAIDRHRKAWAVLRRRAERRAELVDRPNMLATLESDPHWAKATGDVTWWRGEMAAQAATLSALYSMMEGF